MKVCGKLIFQKETAVSIKVSKKDLMSFLNTNSYRKIDSYVVDDMYQV